MHTESQKAFDRDAILRTLWDDPIAQAMYRAVPARLHLGDEYLDLQHLAAGVQRASGIMAPTGGQLSRSSVRPDTWDKLMAQLTLRM